MKNIKFYTEDGFRNTKQDTSIKHKSLDAYAEIQDFNTLLALGREFMTRGDKNGYFDAFWCFDLAVRLRPESFEARLGEYKAWYWYCISISQDPSSSITEDLHHILYAYTPKKYKQMVVEMYFNDLENIPLLLIEGIN